MRRHARYDKRGVALPSGTIAANTVTCKCGSACGELVQYCGKGHFHHSYDHITSDFMVLSVGTADVIRSSADIFEDCLAT